MTLTVAGEPLVGYLLASVRIVAWLVVAPPFSTRAVPTPVKIVLALGLGFAAAPAATHIPLDTFSLLINVAVQAFVGAAMGFVTMLLFQAIATAGSLIDLFGGFSLAQAFDPLGAQMNSVFGRFHQMLAGVLLFVTGGHLMVIGGLIRSFDVLPLGVTPHLPDGAEVMTTAFSMFFLSAVQIALPLVAVLVIADLGLALLTKVAPQLNAITVMFPAKIGLTLLIMGMSLPVLPDALSRLVDLSMQAMAALVGG